MVPDIISRKKALGENLRHYYTGLPCINGHIERRYVSGYKCAGCGKKYAKNYYYKDPKKASASSMNWRRRNKEKAKKILEDWRKRNPDKILQHKKNDYNKNKDRYKATAVARRAAAPRWLTQKQKKQIRFVHILAENCTSIFGEKYHVDHIIPILGKDVCGLHVPWNLRAIPAIENCSKRHKYRQEEALGVAYVH